MAPQQDVRAWRGQTLVDRDGDKIGKIQDVYLDRSSGEPEWIAVKTGLFGSNVSFAPIQDATPGNDELRIAHTKSQVKDRAVSRAAGDGRRGAAPLRPLRALGLRRVDRGLRGSHRA